MASSWVDYLTGHVELLLNFTHIQALALLV